MLDLFAGSGALGMEAASRGAAFVQLVERNPQVARQIQQNLDQLNTPNIQLATGEAQQLLENWSGTPVDILFLDPPFKDDLLAEIVPLLQKHAVLSPNCAIYMETDRNRALPPLPSDWLLAREKVAGNVAYRLFRRN